MSSRPPKKARLGELVRTIALGGSARAWARESGASPTLAFARTQRPDFQGKVDRHRRRVQNQLIGKLLQHSRHAVGLVGDMSRAGGGDAVRLRAGRMILVDVFAIMERVNFEDRLSMMERRFIGQQA